LIHTVVIEVRGKILELQFNLHAGFALLDTRMDDEKDSADVAVCKNGARERT
jgi:hypothetical protein